MKRVLPEECEHPDRSSNSPCFPSSKRSKKVSRRQMMMSSHIDGFGGNSEGFAVLNSSEEVKNLSSFAGIELPISVKLRAYDKVMKGFIQEDCEHPNRRSSSPCLPTSERPIEVSRRQTMVSSHMDEASLEVNSKESQSPASSRSRYNARGRGRKRKHKRKDESSDSEVFAPKHVYVRGQSRRGRSSGNTGRGMLDSGTFTHYFMHLWDDFSGDKVNSFAYFEPYWFHLYSKENNRAKVLGWIKKKGILSKKYVLVPIVLWGHWNLLILCNLGQSLQSEANAPCALLLDSLQTLGPTRLEPLIRRLLLDLYNAEDREEAKEDIKKIPLMIPKVPQQIKGDECGYYVLHFIHLFLQNAPENFDMESYPCFMKKDWFAVDDMESFYNKLDSFPSASSDQCDAASADSSDSDLELIERL